MHTLNSWASNKILSLLSLLSQVWRDLKSMSYLEGSYCQFANRQTLVFCAWNREITREFGTVEILFYIYLHQLSTAIFKMPITRIHKRGAVSFLSWLATFHIVSHGLSSFPPRISKDMCLWTGLYKHLRNIRGERLWIYLSVPFCKVHMFRGSSISMRKMKVSGNGVPIKLSIT